MPAASVSFSIARASSIEDCAPAAGHFGLVYEGQAAMRFVPEGIHGYGPRGEGDEYDGELDKENPHW
jgi:hypothetical protein